MDQSVLTDIINKVVAEYKGDKQEKKHVCNCNKKITLKIAKELIEKVELEAVKMNVKVVIAVVNNCGNPIAVHCMDDSFIASYDIALNKAYTAVSLKMPTKELAKLACPNGPLYGIQNTNNNRIVIFGGGQPLYNNNKLIGGVAVSGSTLENDITLGDYAEQIFKEMTI